MENIKPKVFGSAKSLVFWPQNWACHVEYSTIYEHFDVFDEEN